MPQHIFLQISHCECRNYPTHSLLLPYLKALERIPNLLSSLSIEPVEVSDIIMSSHRRQSSTHSTKPLNVPSRTSIDNGRGRSSFQESWSREVSTARLASPVPSTSRGSPAVPQVPTPQQIGIDSDSASHTPLPGTDGSRSSLPAVGESALANALKGSFRGSPPRFDTPPLRQLSPVPSARGSARGRRDSRTNYGSFDHRSPGPGSPYEDPEIIRRHLRPAHASSSNLPGQADSNNSIKGAKNEKKPKSPSPPRPGVDDEHFSSLQVEGGDITRGIYRWTEEQEAAQSQRYRRSQSFHGSRQPPEDIETMKRPGGFRRYFIKKTVPSSSPRPSNTFNGEYDEQAPPQRAITSSFLEFLSLYGHFAGEDLEDEDATPGVDDYFSSDAYDEGDLTAGDETGDEDREPGEDSALLTPARKRYRKKTKARTATALDATLMLLKSFVGTGVLFLPRAFLNGGMLFSVLVLLFVSLLSYYCFILLVSTRLKHERSFGDLGQLLYGNWMRHLINFSLVISQMGFTSAYIVFVSENLQAFILAVTDCRTLIEIKYLILMQMVIFLPVSLFRNITRIKTMALVADGFIVLGLLYLYYYDIFTLSINHGIADIAAFNSQSWTLFIGTAIFTFEGIGLIIPIQESMKNPKQFPSVLAGVMVGITVIFVSMGALSYAAFGSKTQTVIILNMPQDSKFVNGVQFLYSLAILLSTPLQIFPAIDITSLYLFSRTGKRDLKVKWMKNIFRFFMVMACALIAWVGAGDLDKFVALVGSFACIPLVYIYPPLLHRKAVATSFRQEMLDILLCIFGFGVMVYTTLLTILRWLESESGSPAAGYCDI
ncbi:hypothetical protein M501DRAFT_984976 [Patellaria atrata CBS 101060]|uniref:Amino acid transporter transmembrane domain-containing protein n=1 Tax=Patellaria atrata CBS 101060 TaxID=1346257 RepID=A0A9P4VWK1_9PEZI|nr:hypothetical protein M501DRAFT_984976 [Patellaria atrata CBS 101060]